MSRKFVSFLLVLILTLCAALAENAPVTVADMHNREITLPEPASRIVALMPADCEILCALGCEEALVGVGEYCDYPESVLSLPKVNSGAGINLEEIVALNPQIVIVNDMTQTEAQIQALESAGIQVVVIDAEDIAGVYTAIRTIGTLTAKNDEAEALIADMQSTFADIAEKSEDVGKTVYFEVSPLEWGLWTAGENTFMNELANLCGLTNAFADVNGWGEISEEQVLARDPDYIVTVAMYYGEGPTPVEEIMGRSGWENLKAVANENVLNTDSDEISRPGPRLKDAALRLFALAQSANAEN